jgi:zona occludens toxin
MPITFTTGVPRSGKSYRVSYKIYKEFICKKKTFLQKKFPKIFKYEDTEYLYCYTNINQFNFSIDERIQKLNWEDFYNNMDELRLMHLDGLTDEELIVRAKELKLYKCLICVDEVANLLRKKEDAVILFWLSYHGHFFQDIELIVQHMSMINAEYKKNAEYFYKAIPKQYRIIQKGFKYSQYQTSLMSKTEFIKSFTIPTNQDVFNMYVSGSDPKSTNVILKFLLPIPFVVIYFIYSYSSFSLKDDESNEEIKSIESPKNEIKNNVNLAASTELQTPKNKPSSIKLDPILEEKDLRLFKFNCIKTMCFYRTDEKQTLKIPSNILKTYLLNIDDSKKFLEIKNNILFIYVLVQEERFSFISNSIKRVKNEKNEDSNSKDGGMLNFSN